MENVQSYYDANTRRFLRFGRGGRAGTIHRALWGPGVRSSFQAVRYIHGLVAEELAGVPGGKDERPHFLDLGCGVGATMKDLAERLPEARFSGLTISPEQTSLSAALPPPLPRVVTGDFCSAGDWKLLCGGGPARGAYMIESFVHAPDADELFSLAGSHIGKGGLFLICDDFLVNPRETIRSVRSARLIAEFSLGWHAPTLLTPGETAERAFRHGFVRERFIDLNRFQRINRPRDILFRLLAALPEALHPKGAWFSNIRGVAALQRLTAEGLMSYGMLVLRRTSPL